MKYTMGCKIDKPDNRDLLMRDYLRKIKLPTKVDYTAKMSPVRNQGNFGACVAFACAAGMKEYQEKCDYDTFVKLSPQFLYDRCKENDGWPNEEGTSISVAINILYKYGICQDSFCPYIASSPGEMIGNAFGDALRFKVLKYARILNLTELKTYLASSGPAVIGVDVYQGMMDVSSNGIVPMPKSNETCLGGHALCVVGYDDTTKRLKCKNSWGTGYGEKGYLYLPYTYYTAYANDCWSTVDIDDPNPFTPPPKPSWWDQIKLAWAKLMLFVKTGIIEMFKA